LTIGIEVTDTDIQRSEIYFAYVKGSRHGSIRSVADCGHAKLIVSIAQVLRILYSCGWAQNIFKKTFQMA